MSKYTVVFIIVCVSSVLSNINIRRGGWLDRVVEYYKNKFYDDLKKTPPIKIKATIEKPPPGYSDSTQWDYNSVIRLLTLLRDSEESKEVKRVISRSLRSSRRFMSLSESLKAFPSLAKDHPNDFYYSIDSGEYYADVPNEHTNMLNDDDIIVVSNPVEARLPSARISVHLLKAILENRAEAARYMTTTVKNFSWLPMNFTRNNATDGTTSVTTVADVTGGSGGNSTDVPTTKGA